MTSPVIIDTIPGDKSISHRAIIIGALANGVTHFNGFLCSDDCLNTLKIFQQLGVEIIQDGTSVTVHGRGPGALKSPSTALDVGNSGTGIRLITGALAGTEVTATISGDHSIQQRPMQRIVEPLNQMGANIVATHQKPPLMITGNPKLNSNTSYAMPVASAQVKSALLLAGVAANVPVQVIEPEACRDHTERMLQLFGANVSSKNGTIDLIESALAAPKAPVQIPADISSALFFICYALMSNTPMVLNHIGLNESRIGCLTVLKLMGANIRIEPHNQSYEPMGNIHIQPSQHQKNIDVPLELIPNVIDELPILATLALTQPGTFKVRGAEELRVKESDRIAGICRLVSALGGQVTEYDDGFDITGPLTAPRAFEFDAHFDHRLAMSASIAASVFNVKATIIGKDSIQTSFPNFGDILSQLIQKT